MPANTIVLGAAYQRGALPISAEAMEQAIRLNGAAVEKNLAAFAWGRALVAAPDDIERLTRPTEPEPEPDRPEPSEREHELIDSVAPEDGELRRLLELRVPELVAYQDLAYAERYVGFLRPIEDPELAAAVARNLFKLMAYKDEYEVARLHLDTAERARVRREFGEDVKIAFNLHPPLFRALGLKRKLKLGGWFVPAFRLMRAMRRLRGRWIDPFGHTEVRRLERELIGEYESLVEEGLERLGDENRDRVLELLELPDVIRGYEEIKLRNVALFRKRAQTLLKTIR
jgi:indolepyruvate ferredoxin oxidoreductase